MKARVVHTDLNPCGGAEQVALITIQALIGMGIDVELSTARPTDITRLRRVFGIDKVNAIVNRLKRINAIRDLSIAGKIRDDDNGHGDTITINTHGDMLPYYPSYLSRSNAITYCHFPVASELAALRDPAYLEHLMSVGLIDSDAEKEGDVFTGLSDDHSAVWQSIRDTYLLMLRHSTIVTNSTFSKDAILKAMPNGLGSNLVSSSEQAGTDPLIIPPPVNVNEFCKLASWPLRQDLIIVISRISPAKKLENAISLAKLLKKQRIGKQMIIVGGLIHGDFRYYKHVVNSIKACGLTDFVKLEVNVSINHLKSILRGGRVYFHPTEGEPFGISIAEAMSAGLIPVVPNIGGQTDFVPARYRFTSLEDAASKISVALKARHGERSEVSDLVTRYSEKNFVTGIQNVIKTLLQEKRTVNPVVRQP